MPVTPLAFQQGDTLAIRDSEGRQRLFGVVERKRGGYLLKPFDGSDPQTWSDDQLDDVYGMRQLTHFPCNLQGLPQVLAEVLDKAWEAWPEEIRLEAERRAVYVAMVDVMIERCPTRLEAYVLAGETVFAAHAEAWKREDAELAVRKAAEITVLRRRRKPRRENAIKPVMPPLRRPSPYTVRDWYLVWSAFGRDIRLLLPHKHRRGNRRPVYKRQPDDKPDSHSLMGRAAELHYFRMPRKRKKYAYGKYLKFCEEDNVKPFSFRTFRVFIKNNWTERDEYRRRYGDRAAYLKFGIFERRAPPDRPLEEVEVDHCLIDLIIVHPVTGKPLGRPWLTVVLDRATRTILGGHISFEVPSYAALQRAIAHAMWKKDLSSIGGLVNDWPCHGVFNLVFCDQGMDLRCASLRASEAQLGFKVIPLPGNSPWLKGAVERLFGTIGTQVFSFEEGTILSRTRDFYDPVKRAKCTLAEINAKLLKWIVDDYHVTRHETLGCSPLEKWRQLTDLYPVRPVPSFDQIVRLTGEIVPRTISNVGINYRGLLYSDKAILESLLQRRGALKKDWLIRLDPYDWGEVWILDDEGQGGWHVLPCTDQDISRGVSKYQHHVHCAIARKNLPPGTPVTAGHLAAAKRYAEDQVQQLFENGATTTTTARAARYSMDGTYFTPLWGMPKAKGQMTCVSPGAVVDRAATPLVSPRTPDPAPPPDFRLEIEQEADRWTREMVQARPGQGL